MGEGTSFPLQSANNLDGRFEREMIGAIVPTAESSYCLEPYPLHTFSSEERRNLGV